MNKKKVLIFSLAYYPWVGGAEVAIRELTDRLPQYDWELVTVNLGDSQAIEEMVGNVRVFRLPGGFWGKYLFPWRAARWATRRHQLRPYDLIWGMMANQAGMAAAKFKKIFPTVSFLLTLQEGDDLDSLSYRLKLFLPKALGVFRLPDQIQVISRYLGKWARLMGATCPITVMPNGVDLERFKLKAKSYLPDDKAGKLKADPIIITTSRLVKKNGIDDLIKSLTFLSDNVKLEIVGAGEEEEALKRLVESLGLASRVSFLGYKPSLELPQYLERADVFCRPSRSEGLGNSFLEAMAVGLPVIGTPVGGIPDFLHGGKHLDTRCPSSPEALGHLVSKCQTGWLCRVNDPKSVAEQVRFILAPANEVAVRTVIQQAQQLVSENYNWDKLALRFAEILSKP